MAGGQLKVELLYHHFLHSLTFFYNEIVLFLKFLKPPRKKLVKYSSKTRFLGLRWQPSGYDSIFPAGEGEGGTNGESSVELHTLAGVK